MRRIPVRSTLCLVFAFCFFLIPSLSSAWQNGDTIYVDRNAHGNGSGLSWNDAFTTIQEAIDSVNPGTEVNLFVAQGVYLEHNITLNDGIKLYGSFEGHESSLGDRRDVWTNDHWTVIDAERQHRVLNMKNRTEVNGFILRNGLRDYTLQSNTTLDDSRGGGIYIECDDDAVVRNNIIEDCAVFWQGGGIFIEGSCNNTPAAPLIEFNVIRSCTGYCGGGIEIAGVPEGAPGGTDAIIRHNILRNNADGGTSELGFGLELWTEYENQCSPRMGDFYNNIIIGFRNERDWNIDAADVWVWARNSIDRSFISQEWYQGEFLYDGCYKFGNPNKSNIFGSDPMFIDEANNNYRLRPGSPCIGTGRGGVNIGLFPYSGDTQAPVISSVASGGITFSVATITWSTNEPADSQVEYGLTTSYGSSTPLNTSLVTNHSMTLSGLSAGTTYHYRVKSKDAAGNLAVRGDYNFTTSTFPDTQFPVISNVASSAITSSGATITWSTNEPADSQVEYGLTTSYGSSTPLNTSLVTNHSMTLSGLSASTTYHYRVKSKDKAANPAVSEDYSFTTAAQSPAGWDGYGYRRLITIDYTKVSPCSSNLSNFPVLISLSGTWLKTTGNGGRVYSPNGYDIIFKASDGVTQLNHEVEKYDGSAGTLVAWVRVPTLSYTANTTIYIYYGNSAITTYQSIPSGVWDSNYKGVWHLKENPSGTAPQIKDSTSNANNGTSYGGMTSADQVAGKIGSGLDVETDDYISAANNGSALNVGQAFTLEAWIKRDTMGSKGLLMKRYGGAYSFKLSFTSSDVLRLDVYNGSGYNNVQGNTIRDTNWHYIGGYSDGTSLKLFTDGTVHASTGTKTGTIPYDSNTLYMGAGMWSSTPRDFFDGIIDEVRISNVGRNACWIKTSYLNQNSPSTFSTVGNEESTPTVDTQAPVISSVATSGITSNGATVTWWTSEASDSQVEYGLTASYGSSTSLNTSPVTSHSVVLSELSASTTYHYRVKSKDAASNAAASADYSFTTAAPPDTQAPLISSVASGGITSSAATITWTTNEASDSQVEYGLTTSYGSSTTLNTSQVTNHSVTPSGLSASTTYHYRVKSRDAAGNQAVSGDFSFTTAAPPDTQAPVISSVASSDITTSGATITWTTNEASDSQVEYGLTTSYGSSTPPNTNLVTSHSVALSGLSDNTAYHYRVKSKDAAGNLATGQDFTLTTAAISTNNIVLQSVQTYGNLHAGGVVATITGDDNRNASTELLWRQVGESSFRTGHPLSRIDATHFVGSLFWLNPGTSYEVQVAVSDPDGVSGSPSSVTSLVTRAESLPEPSTRTLYVATIGSDSNAGTSPAAPFRTIQKAATTSQPGDLILIQPGIYRESVNIPTSGTASQPIVFRGNGTGVILDGADATIAAGVTWTAYGGGVSSRVTGFPTSHVVTDLGRLYEYGNLTALQSLGAGAPGGFYFDGTTLYVKFSDGSSPASHTLYAARFEEGFSLSGRSHIRIENMEIRHYGSGGYGKGVYLSYCSDIVVRYCKIHEVEAADVWIKGGDRHRIEDNEIWDTAVFNWPWTLGKAANPGITGIRFTDDAGRGHVLRRNTIHGTFNGIGIDSSEVAPAPGVTNEIDVYENVLYQHLDDAFEPEGPYTSNFRFWSNQIQDVHMVFSLAPVGMGPVWVLYNVVYGHGNIPSGLSDASFLKINNGYSTDNGPVFLYHNTVFTDAPSTNAIRIMEPAQSPFIKLRNNVLAGTLYVLEIDSTVPAASVGLDMNGDDLYTTDTTRLIKWFNDVRYTNLISFRTGTGQEPQGLSVAPAFVNQSAGDLRLVAGSALIDAGVLLPGINDAYVGYGPDIGAFEYGLGGDTAPPTVPTGLTATAISSTQINLSWTASTDNVGVTEYRIYRDGSQIATTPITSYQDTGLSPSTTYAYRVAAYDAAGNVSAQSSQASATTPEPPDTQAPVISSVASNGITSIGATITWTTNEASDSQVEYGLTASYGSSTSLNTSPVTSHSVVLSGLSASTTYHYRVKSRDAVGNLATGQDDTFTTAAPPDTTPPVISSVASNGITSIGATITWTTNEASDSQVEYGLTASYGSSTSLNGSLVTSHAVALSGLNASTTYHYRVKSRDAVGNLATGQDDTFTTAAPPDTTPPAISSVISSGVTSSGATITWTTNEASDSQVEYGLTTSYGSSTTLSTSPVTSHSVVLSGLSASTTYHYRVKSKDGAGNAAVSVDYGFTTAAPPDTTPPVISSVTSSGVTSSGATITWTTNESSDSQVEYGLTTSYGSSTTLSTSLATSHSVVLSGLSASTTYHYRVKSRDAAGNLGTSGDYSFTTSTQPSGGWDGYRYRRLLSIDYTKVSPCSSNLSNFPVLISLSGTWLKTTGNGGRVYSSNGYDIIFRSSDGVTQLNHEIEKYDGSAGTLVAWVKVPILSYTTNTAVYIYYGNSGISSSLENKAAVWDSNYKGVWHLKENPSGTAPQMKDSTSYGNNGTSYGSMTSGDQVAGKIGSGLDVEIDDYIGTANNGSTLNVGQAFTLEAWVKRDTTGPKTVMAKKYGSAYSFKLSFTSSDVLRLDVYNGNSYNNVQGSTITDTNWHYVGAYSNGTSLKLITDGVVHSNTGSKSGTIPYDSNSLWMGVGIWGGNPVDYFDGIIDEVRVSNVVRSDCWIKTGYLNQNSPSTFYTVGNEE